MSDNLISRQAVLDIIQDEWNLHIGYDSDIALGSVKNRVTALPIAYNKEAVVEQLEEKTEFLKDCTKYGNKNAKQQEKSYSTMMMYEVADLVDDLIDTIKAGGIDERS